MNKSFNSPLVTVFIPTYNVEKYVKRSIESIIQQTYSNLEIIIIDDGSTDRTVEIIKRINDKRIKVYMNSKNMGIPFTRQRGLDLATGKYFAVMDSDDLAVSDRIEKEVGILEDMPNIDIVSSDYKLFKERIKRVVKLHLSSAELKILLMFTCMICNPSTMFRLSKIKDNHIKYNPNYFVAQDYRFWADLSGSSNFYNIREPLLLYRTGHANISNVSRKHDGELRKRLIDQIHSDLLGQYGFKLNREQLKIFNTFFGERQKGQVPISLAKLVELRYSLIKQNRVFDSSDFARVLDFVITKKINNNYSSIYQVTVAYIKLVKNKNIVSLFMCIIKVLLNKVKEN